MFFSLSFNLDSRFSNHYSFGNIILNTDSGWLSKDVDNTLVVYKGYCDECPVTDILLANERHYGNFCIFRYNKETKQIEIYTDHWRSFIFWVNENNEITNLVKHSTTIWADSNVSVDQELNVVETKKDVIGEIVTDPITLDKGIEFIYDKLYSKIKKFVEHNTLPLHAFLSGGIDSMLVFSFVKKITSDYEFIFENRMQWDYFWCQNHKHIARNFWGYTQIHHWTDPCVLLSGAPGDEFMFRNPNTIFVWSKYHGIDIEHYFDKKYRYEQKTYYYKKVVTKYDNSIHDMDTVEFSRYLCNQMINDAQHWHLGNTLTFTPLRDLDIFKMFLRLDPDELGPQIGGGEISLKLIEMNDPDLLNYLSDIKNLSSTYHNLSKLMDKVLASSGQ